ncbi:OmpA family protein [Pseudomonas sp. R2.Fl]|nr:OmpA family protein [Pseudomonas sp. R2.Fl]
MTAAVDQNREIEQLKTLLFQMETARLDTLETDVASLQRYVGGADRLETATADVLVAALARAEVNRPRELANAIAPSVVSAIRSEIRNSRDLMVDALYPITGRMVSAAVANAFRELVAFLEQRINALTSSQLWTGRIKSLVTGRPISEFVLTAGTPRVNRMLLIERGNGLLVADWTREETSGESTDLLSAMVAAILEFSVQALTGEGSLQKLDLGGREIVLRASPRFILAAECFGPLRPSGEARIDTLFFDAIESINGGSECDGAMLASLAASFETDAAPKQDRRGKTALLALVALAVGGLAWLGGTSVTRTMLEWRVGAALEQLSAGQPLLASFPLRLEFDHRDRSVSVLGVEPSAVEIAPVVDALATAAEPYRIVNRIGVVPGLEEPAALRAEVAALRAEIEATRGEIAEAAVARDRQYERLRDDLRGSIAKEARLSGQRHAELSGKHDRLRDTVAVETESRNRQFAELSSIADGPAQRLDRFMASTAIFFGSGDTFADGGEADRQIRRLAALLAGNDLRIRLVGHTDESGSERANRMVARRRADLVMQQLLSLGIARERLFVVSRSASTPITDGAGTAGGENRRVTFENVFQTEVAR